jgi:Dienelactone hydrolase family
MEGRGGETMKTMKTVIGAVLVGCLAAAPVAGQAEGSGARRPALWPGLVAGPFQVGYRVLREYDFSRSFRRKTDALGMRRRGEIARPVQISVWYPADSVAGGVRVPVRAYYDAVASETDFAARTPEELDAGLAEFERILAAEWNVPTDDVPSVLSRLDSLLAGPSSALGNVRPAAGRYPLVLHLPGYNASPNHHYPLFEYLASHGYVVAAVPNMGAYRRNIDDEAMSLDVQARDLEFAFSVVRELPFVDEGRVATTGMSWGGLSNVLFATRNANVDAVVTFDGAVTMPEELSLLEAVPGFRHGTLRAAYLQFLVDPKAATFRPKDLRFWDSLRYAPAYQRHFAGVAHDDFAPGNLRLYLLAAGDPADRRRMEGFTRFVAQETLRFLDAWLKGNEEARSRLEAGPLPGDLPAGMLTLAASKEPGPAVPTPEEFGEAVVVHGVDAALELLEALGSESAARGVVQSSVLGPLYMEALGEGRLEEALGICRIWARGMPGSPGPLFSMARVLREMGDVDGAVDALERIVAMDPGAPAADNAREALRRLRGGDR